MRGCNYDPNMPSLADLNEMKYKTVLNYLCSLNSSIYKGEKPVYVKNEINENTARKYLADRILLNDRRKADLHLISELGSFDENCSYQSKIEDKLNLLSSAHSLS